MIQLQVGFLLADIVARSKRSYRLEQLMHLIAAVDAQHLKSSAQLHTLVELGS